MDWKARLAAGGGVLVSDGAWGTQLAARGLPPGTTTELWNVENPAAVEAVARAYVEAGADVILTNTFGGSRLKLARAGLADRAAELNRAGAALSRRAAGAGALVFASIGPTGEFLPPLGSRPEQEFLDAFAEQIAACLDGGADGLCIETLAALDEARVALRAARMVRPAVPVVVSMTYAPARDGFATMMGVRPDQAARELDAAGADLIGSNCGAGVANLVPVTRLLRSATAKPLWIKANAGLPELVDGRTVYRETPEAMAAQAPALLDAGANVVGGCCGTGPDHIRALAAAVRARRGG